MRFLSEGWSLPENVVYVSRCAWTAARLNTADNCVIHFSAVAWQGSTAPRSVKRASRKSASGQPRTRRGRGQ
eukprot:5978828-Alexandrium_andersonii.AAC.1